MSTNFENFKTYEKLNDKSLENLLMPSDVIKKMEFIGEEVDDKQIEDFTRNMEDIFAQNLDKKSINFYKTEVAGKTLDEIKFS